MPEPPLPLIAPTTTASGDLDCDLLVFDLDGTLVDSQQDLANSVNATLAFLHRHPLDVVRICAFIGNGAASLVQRALDATGDASEQSMAAAMPFFLQYYREHNLDHTCPYPGVVTELKRIRALSPSLAMAVLTNKPIRPSQHICDGLHLTPFFFAIYGGDSFMQKKPSPLGLQSLMREASDLLGRPVAPRRTVLVGDSRVDVKTARAAGTLCVGCGYGLDPDGLRLVHQTTPSTPQRNGWKHCKACSRRGMLQSRFSCRAHRWLRRSPSLRARAFHRFPAAATD